MISPTAHHLEGFFHGLTVGQQIAGKTARGQTAASAIGRELTSLKLLQERQNAQEATVQHLEGTEDREHFFRVFLPHERRSDDKVSVMEVRVRRCGTIRAVVDMGKFVLVIMLTAGFCTFLQAVLEPPAPQERPAEFYSIQD